MKRLTAYILLLLFATSCSPQKRIARIAKKYNLTQTVTREVADTLILPGDTFIVEVPERTDTVLYIGDREIEILYDDTKHTQTIRSTTPPDTIIRTIEVKVPEVVIVEKNPGWMKKAGFLLVVLIAAALVYHSIKNGYRLK